MAKNTRPQRVKNKPAPVGVSFGRNTSPRDAKILAAMWPAVVEVLATLRAKDEEEARRAFKEYPLSLRSGLIIATADDAPRVYNFEGFAVTCAPSALPFLFDKLARVAGAKYNAPALAVETAPEVTTVEEVLTVVGVPPLTGPTPAPVVESAPVAPAVEAEPVRPVEVKRARRASAGRLVARLVVAFLSLIIAALRVVVAAVRLAERGRLVEIVRAKVARRVEVSRENIARRVQTVRRTVVEWCEAVRCAVVRCVEVKRAKIARRVEAVRCGVAVWRSGVARRVQGLRLLFYYRVEVVRARVVGAIVQAVQLAAFALIVAARRVEAVATHLDNI